MRGVSDNIAVEIAARIERADDRYGPFRSTHEAMGVALEEWTEFIEAVRSNQLLDIYEEALDLAAVMIRLAGSLQDDELARRSVK